MAEMSFGPRMRAPRAAAPSEKDNNGLFGALGLNQHMAFLQGCVASRPADTAMLVVDFPNRPAKMLGAVIADYGPSSLLQVQLCDLPRLPLGKLKPTELVVEVHSASVNPTDWKQRKGTLSTMCPLKLPTILGIDFSGKVMRAGEDSPFKEGEEVFGRQTLDRMRELNGTYSEYVIVDSHDVFHKPANLSHDEAAAVPHACLAAYSALGHVGKLLEKKKQKDKAVLILGASGGVGSFAVQLAKKHWDCFVVASCSGKNADLVTSLGADKVLDYEDPLFLKGAGMHAFDVILDCVGGDDYWQAFKGSLSHTGVYVTLVGNKRYLADDKSIDYGNALQIRADYLLRQISNQLGASENYHIMTGSQVRSQDLKIIASLLERRALRVVIEKAVSLYEIGKAHDLSETHHAVGKIILQIKQPPKPDPEQELSAAKTEQDFHSDFMKSNGARGAPPGLQAERGAPPRAERELDPRVANILNRNLNKTREEAGPTSPMWTAQQTAPETVGWGMSDGVRDSYSSASKDNVSLNTRGVTFDKFRPPGDPTPPVSPGNRLTPPRPPSMHRDDETSPPDNVMGFINGQRPGELPSRSPTAPPRHMGGGEFSNSLGTPLAGVEEEEAERSPGGGKGGGGGGGAAAAAAAMLAARQQQQQQQQQQDAAGSASSTTDLTARLEALQKEVAESAQRVKTINQTPVAPGAAAAGRMAGGVGMGGGRTGITEAIDEEAGRDFDQDDIEATSEEEEEEEEEVVAPPPQQPTTPRSKAKAEEDMIMADQVMRQRQQLEAQAKEEGGAALGAGGIFKRPSPAELLKGAKPVGQTVSAAAILPGAAAAQNAPAPAQSGPAEGKGGLRPAPVVMTQHSGCLRRKKENHGRFEDPYKQVCVCRVQDHVLKVRSTKNGELVGQEEIFDMGQWRILPQVKDQRLTLNRAAPLPDQVNVVTFKADTKGESDAWHAALQKAEALAKSKPPQTAQAAPTAPKVHAAPTAPKVQAAPGGDGAQRGPSGGSNGHAGNNSGVGSVTPRGGGSVTPREGSHTPRGGTPAQASPAQPRVLQTHQVGLGGGGPSPPPAPAAPPSATIAPSSTVSSRAPIAPSSTVSSRAPESSSMAELRARNAGGGAENFSGAGRLAAPESNSLAELRARQGAVNGVVGMLNGGGGAAADAALPPKAPKQPSGPPGPPAGVGIIFKESRRNSTTALVVKQLAPGGPAETSGTINVGDILLKVDGKDVNTTERATELILGPRGSPIVLMFKRFAEDKVDKFSVTLNRGTPAVLPPT